MKIKSIEVGYGEESTFYSTSDKVHEHYHVDKIECTEQYMGKGLRDHLTLMVYEISRGGEVIAMIEAMSGVHVVYEQEATE